MDKSKFKEQRIEIKVRNDLGVKQKILNPPKRF